MADFMNGDCFKIYLVAIYSVGGIKVEIVFGIERHLRRAAKTLLPAVGVGYGIEQADGASVCRRACHRSGGSEVGRDRARRQSVVDSQLLLVGCRRNQPDSDRLVDVGPDQLLSV